MGLREGARPAWPTLLLAGSFVFLVGNFLPTDLLIGAQYFAYDSLEKRASVAVLSAGTAG